MMVDHKNFSNT